MRKLYITLLALSFFIKPYAQNGSVDSIFGNNGFVSTPSSWTYSRFFQVPRQCFVQPDGRILIVVFGAKTSICRRMANGLPDSSYGYKGISEAVSINTSSAAMQTDGKIVVAGNLNGGSDDFAIARFNADGSLDKTFGNAGVTVKDIDASLDGLTSIVITPDNKIITGGNTSKNGFTTFALIGYTAFGLLDNSFGTNGVVITNFDNNQSGIFSLAVQPDGKIIAAGSTWNGPGSNVAVARYNTDGTLDPEFNGNGKLIADFGYEDVALSTVVGGDNKIYVGGYSIVSNGVGQARISRYNSNGTPDLSYNNGEGSILISLRNSSDYLTNIRMSSDGSVVASGTTSIDPSDIDVQLVRIKSNGTIDQQFGDNGLVLVNLSKQDQSNFLTIQNDGKILTGEGNFDLSLPNSAGYTCLRFNGNGTPDYSFGQNGIISGYLPSSYFNYTALHQLQDGKLLAAASANDGADTHVYLSRFNANGTSDNTFGINGQKELPHEEGAVSIFQPDGKLLKGAYFSDNAGDIVILRYTQDGFPDASFGVGGKVVSDFGGNETVSTITLQADGKIVMGASVRDNAGSDWLITRYNADGSLDQGFGTGGFTRINLKVEDNVQNIAIGPDGSIFIGGTSIEYAPDFSSASIDVLLGKFHSNGTPDLAFGNNGLKVIDANNWEYMGYLAIQPNGKSLFTFWSVNSNNYSDATIYLQRLNPDGSPDNSFGTNGQTKCESAIMTLQTDQKILISGSTLNKLNNNVDFAISRLNPNGLPDNSFGTNGRLTHSFLRLENSLMATLLAGNKFFAAGNGLNDYGLTQGLIVKLNLDASSSITCPSNVVVPTDKNRCSAKVSGIDPKFSADGAVVIYRLTGATKDSGKGSASGKIFKKGITTVTYTLNNDSTKSCSFTVKVEDKELPVIEDMRVDAETLWPADHRMRDIKLSYTAYDNCGIKNIKVSVTSNEPVQSSEPGDQSPDWQILDNHHLRLRAEKLKNSDERVYTISLTAIDESGNQSVRMVTVKVLKPQPEQCILSLKADPNPSRNYFRVSVSSTCNNPISLRLTDYCGRTVSTIPNITSPSVIKIGEKLRPGLYYLEARQKDNKKVIKLLKL